MYEVSGPTFPLVWPTQTISFWAESLNSVTNSDVADTDDVQVQIEIYIYCRGSFITEYVHFYFNSIRSTVHTVSICDVRIHSRV